MSVIVEHIVEEALESMKKADGPSGGIAPAASGSPI